jgi:hypothetical protein
MQSLIPCAEKDLRFSMSDEFLAAVAAAGPQTILE